MSDLRTQLHDYLEGTREVTYDEVASLAAERAVADVLPQRYASWLRGPLIAVGTAAVIVSVGLAASFILRGPGSADTISERINESVTTLVTTLTVPAAPTTTNAIPVPDTASGWVYNPELSGDERVVLVSEWAQERNLLTSDDVVAALAEPTTKPMDATSPEVANYPDYWGSGFLFPFPSDEAVMDAGVSYDLHKEGDSRNVVMGVSEYVIEGPTIAETYATMEAAERQRNTPDEQYDPAPIGVDAFAFETDGGSGAIHHLVVVNTGDALVVIATGPASPDYPEADLTEGENLTREQVDNVVRVAVEKLLGDLRTRRLDRP